MRDHEQTFCEGRQAYWQNKHVGFNLYKPGSADYRNWEAGWYDAFDEDERNRGMSRDYQGA